MILQQRLRVEQLCLPAGMWQRWSISHFTSSSRRRMIATRARPTRIRQSVQFPSTASASAFSTSFNEFVMTGGQKDNRPALFRLLSSSTCSNTTQDDKESNGSTTTDGQTLWQEYQSLQEQLQTLEKEKEEAKSQEMYQAWQHHDEMEQQHKQQQEKEQQQQQQQQNDDEPSSAAAANNNNNNQNNTRTGVAVVRTLVQQTRLQLEQEQDQQEELKRGARNALERAARSGHPAACVTLGNDCAERAVLAMTTTTTTIPPPTPPRTRRRLQRQPEILARRQDTTTASSASAEPDQTTTAEEWITQALNWYQSANSTEGWYNHGNLLWTGFPDQTATTDDGGEEEERQNGDSSLQQQQQDIILPRNPQAAMESFEKAIALDDADAMYFVGVHCLSMDDNHDQLHRGFRLIQQAAHEKGHDGALYYLALLHLNGNEALGIDACQEDGDSDSLEPFTSRLDAAVEAGHAEAQFLRGHSYYYGQHGYEQDYAQALKDFLRAADNGHAAAAVSAGAMLHQGVVVTSDSGSPVVLVPRDQAKAFALYQHAGELGSNEGWRNVIACYLTGEGVTQSTAMARYIAKTIFQQDLKV